MFIHVFILIRININVVKLGQVIRSRGLMYTCTCVKTVLSQSIIEVIFIISFIGGTIDLLFYDFSIHTRTQYSSTCSSEKLIVLSYTYT